MESATQIIISVISSGLLASVVTHLFTSRKLKAEAKSSEIQNVQLYIETYTKMIEDLQSRINELLGANNRMRDYYDERINIYEGKLDELKKTIQSLTRSNRSLHKEITELKANYPCKDCLNRNE